MVSLLPFGADGATDWMFGGYPNGSSLVLAVEVVAVSSKTLSAVACILIGIVVCPLRLAL